MPEEALETVQNLLKSATEEVDDSDVQYKLNSARQLLVYVQDHLDEFDTVIHDAVDDDELLERLREMGYLE